jgi:hypothetical protein
MSDIDLSRIPPTRVKYLARLGAASRSAAIARMPDNKRIATLLAFIHLLEYTATDDVIDLFDLLVKGLLSKSKREGILPNGTIDRKAYTFCVLQCLRSALRRWDVFVVKSQRYCDPRAKLLSDQAWSAQRAGICRTLDLQPTFDSSLSILKQELDEAYRRTAANFENSTAIHIEHKDGKDNLVLTPLDKLVDPPSLVTLKRQVAAMLPHVDLPEVMLEINSRTGFTKEFTHLSQANSRVEDLHISICAVLAQACNIGLEPLVRPELPALTRGRLSWVQQNYLRQETLIRANARLVDTQTHIPLAQIWGGGEVASADGLRFTVPVRTINAAPNSKYFGVGKGIIAVVT